MRFYSTCMTAPGYWDSVVEAESLQCCVGLTVLQHQAEAALLILWLRIRQTQSGDLLVLLLVLHLHIVTADTHWSCVVPKTHCIVVHARHREDPLHLLVVREAAGIVGGDEVRVRHASWQVDLYDGQHWTETRRNSLDRSLKLTSQCCSLYLNELYFLWFMGENE